MFRKIVVLIVIMSVMVCSAAFAGGKHYKAHQAFMDHLNEDRYNHNELYVSLDAPKLINLHKLPFFNENWHLGPEIGKLVGVNMGYSDDFVLDWDDGWFGVGRITFDGCLIGCKK